MLHDLQALFVLAHPLVESAGRQLSIAVRTMINTVDDPSWPSRTDSVLERLHWAPVSAAVLAAASFAGFLLLVRYLQSPNRRPLNSDSPHLPPTPDLSAFDIFISVATAVIGLTVCWATG